MALAIQPLARQVLKLFKEVAVGDTTMQTVGMFQKSSLTSNQYIVGKQMLALSIGTSLVEGAYIDVTVEPTRILNVDDDVSKSVYQYTLITRGIHSDNTAIPPDKSSDDLRNSHAGGQSVAVVVDPSIFNDLLNNVEGAVDDNLAAMQALLDTFEADITQQQTDFEADINQQWDDWQALNDPAELEVINQKPVVTTTETEFSSGVRNHDFSKTGDIAATTVVGEIGDSGWYNENTTDLSCSITKGVMKLVSGSGGEFFGNTPNKFTTLDSTDKKFLIPAVAGDDYRWSICAKLSELASLDCKFYLRFLDEDLATLQTTNISFGAVDMGFQTKTAEVVTPADSVYCVIAANLNSALTIEIDSIKLEKVIEFDITGQENVSSARVGLGAISRNVMKHEGLETAGNWRSFGGAVGSATIAEDITEGFIAKSTNFSRFDIETAQTGSGSTDLILTIEGDDGTGKADGNVIAQKILTSGFYGSLTIDLPCTLEAGTSYVKRFSTSSGSDINYIRVRISTTDSNSDGDFYEYINSTWVNRTWNVAFRDFYSDKTNTFDVALHNEKIKLKSENRGLLNESVLDLENGKYKYDSGLLTTEENFIKFANDILSASDGGGYATSIFINAINNWAGESSKGLLSDNNAATKNIVLKVDTILPCSKVLITRSTFWDATYDCTISISEDGVSYTELETDGDAGGSTESENISIINNKSVFYIKLSAIVSKYINLLQLKIEADIDTSSVKNLYSAPKDRVMYETISSVLPSACVRAYRRDSKFGFPAIEFTDVSENYIGHEFLAFDFTGMALYFDQQTVADDAYITITSTENPEVDVHGTLTTNRLLVASNPDEDGSIQGKVIYSSVNQGLIYDVRDVRKDMNKVKKGLEENNAETAENTTNTATNTANIATNTANVATNTADILANTKSGFDFSCPFPLADGTPLLKIIPYTTPLAVTAGKQWLLTSYPLDVTNGDGNVGIEFVSTAYGTANLKELNNAATDYKHMYVNKFNNVLLDDNYTLATSAATPTDIPVTILEFDENVNITPIVADLYSADYTVPAGKCLVVLTVFSFTLGGRIVGIENSAGTSTAYVRIDKPIILPEGAKVVNVGYATTQMFFSGYLIPDTLIF